MIIVGLTGSMAMGKSQIAKFLKLLRIPVNDADKTVHDILKNDQNAYKQIKKIFPKACVENIVDRKALSAYIQKDSENLVKLEKILHPIVREKTLDFINQQRNQRTPIICLDIPLLFEKDMDQDEAYGFDYIILASAPSYVQQSRILNRPGMTHHKMTALLNNQLPDSEKRKRTDFIVETGLSKAYTFKQIKSIINEIRKT